MRSFDVVVIGAGPGGEVAAGRLADAGLEVAIVEDRKVGGECSFWACMPSKSLLRPGELLAESHRVPGVGAGDHRRPLDVPAVLARRDEVIHDLDDSSQLPWLEQRGIALLRGWGRLDGEKRVVVGDEAIEVAPRRAPRRRHDAGAAADRRPAPRRARGPTATRPPPTPSRASSSSWAAASSAPR